MIVAGSELYDKGDKDYQKKKGRAYCLHEVRKVFKKVLLIAYVIKKRKNERILIIHECPLRSGQKESKYYKEARESFREDQ